MSDFAVRRLGIDPCTDDEYKRLCKREALINADDFNGLKKFDEAEALRNKPVDKTDIKG